MNPEDLTLLGIDTMRHTVVSVEIVAAITFAVRAGHTVDTAYRFVTALVMTDDLSWPGAWPTVLRTVMELERKAA